MNSLGSPVAGVLSGFELQLLHASCARVSSVQLASAHCRQQNVAYASSGTGSEAVSCLPALQRREQERRVKVVKVEQVFVYRRRLVFAPLWRCGQVILTQLGRCVVIRFWLPRTFLLSRRSRPPSHCI